VKSTDVETYYVDLRVRDSSHTRHNNKKYTMEQEKESKKALATLDVKRKALETEMDAIVSELKSKGPDGQPPMGVDTPLTDQDGYPRADIDVYRARTLRQRLNVIRTDHKALMKDVEQGLIKVPALKVRLFLCACCEKQCGPTNRYCGFLCHDYSNLQRMKRPSWKRGRNQNQSPNLIRRQGSGL
jgi:hypothetical protein